MKRRIAAVALIVVCLSILAYNSLAYFTAEDTAYNVITAGAVEISVEQWQQTEKGLVPYPKNTPITVMPGTGVSKIVTVKNHDAPSLIRAKLEVTVTDAYGEELPFKMDDEIILLTINTKDWTQKDGWWYYNSSVDTNTVTQPLMTEVKFDGLNMTNEYQNCIVLIDVTAQAVQAANNADTALEATGWPEE